MKATLNFDKTKSKEGGLDFKITVPAKDTVTVTFDVKAATTSSNETLAGVVVYDETLQIAPKPPQSMETRKPWPPANMTSDSDVTKCQCGPGSGDPDSCCSKCGHSKDKHNVPDCPGGGKNTGPFCGNDFHVTEPNACYGDKPLCCTNDMGKPVCCKKHQVCHSPLVGDNRCVDKDEVVVV